MEPIAKSSRLPHNFTPLEQKQIIIIAIDPDEGEIEAVSYGETKALCAEARRLADAAFEAIMRAF